MRSSKCTPVYLGTAFIDYWKAGQYLASSQSSCERVCKTEACISSVQHLWRRRRKCAASASHVCNDAYWQGFAAYVKYAMLETFRTMPFAQRFLSLLACWVASAACVTMPRCLCIDCVMRMDCSTWAKEWHHRHPSSVQTLQKGMPQASALQMHASAQPIFFVADSVA